MVRTSSISRACSEDGIRVASYRARTYDDRYLGSGVMRGPSTSTPYDLSDVPAPPYRTEPDAEGGVPRREPNPNMRHPTPQFVQVHPPMNCSRFHQVTPRPRNSSAARASRNHAKLTVARAAEHGEMWASQIVARRTMCARTPGDIMHPAVKASAVMEFSPQWGSGFFTAWQILISGSGCYVDALRGRLPELITAKVVDVCLRGVFGA
ncbi:hypothetical protein JB92DRAFT_2824994 [Gautieria morchelliformis]|nr:hypothetical protein JB92DRAFT_2824994 [Gautieria morchelliformis]